MSLLEPIVLLDVVKVVTPHHDGSVHLHLGDDTGQDTATNGNLASEWTLLVNIASTLGLVGDLESKTRVAEKSGLRWLESSLLVQEDGGLLLVGPLGLFGHDWISCRSESSN